MSSKAVPGVVYPLYPSYSHSGTALALPIPLLDELHEHRQISGVENRWCEALSIPLRCPSPLQVDFEEALT